MLNSGNRSLKSLAVKAEELRILLRTRCNEYVINGFTFAEITELIREIACH